MMGSAHDQPLVELAQLRVALAGDIRGLVERQAQLRRPFLGDRP
jgi:hypothetical protein